MLTGWAKEHMAQLLCLLRDYDQDDRRRAEEGYDDPLRTNILSAIIDKLGCWPTISLLGAEASYAAWLIAQHSDHNRPFQARCLNMMQEVSNDVLGENVAMLTDRVLINSGNKQRYGTQILHTNKNGLPVPFPIRDEKHVDERRATFGMRPLQEALLCWARMGR